MVSHETPYEAPDLLVRLRRVDMASPEPLRVGRSPRGEECGGLGVMDDDDVVALLERLCIAAVSVEIDLPV